MIDSSLLLIPIGDSNTFSIFKGSLVIYVRDTLVECWRTLHIVALRFHYAEWFSNKFNFCMYRNVISIRTETFKVVETIVNIHMPNSLVKVLEWCSPFHADQITFTPWINDHVQNLTTNFAFHVNANLFALHIVVFSFKTTVKFQFVFFWV